MASTYTTNQGIEKPATGEQSGTWGATTNTNFDIIDRALSGVGALSLTGTSTTLTTTDGSLTDGMYKVLVLGGSPSGTNTITLSDNTQDKFYFVVNASGEEVQFSQGTGANATIANGYADIIYADGAGSGAAVASLFATGLKIGTDLKVGDDLSLVSDSAVLGFGADNDTTLTHTDGTGLTLNSTNKLTFGDAASFIQQSGDGILQIDGEATINMNASTALTVTTDTATFTSANSTDPVVIIKNTTNDTSAARLHFVKDKGAAGADGDDIGTIEFISDDSGQAQTSFAKIVAEVSESANTDEAGKLSLFVAESDGTTTALTAGLVLEGEHATDGEVDVTIGAATTSTTTVAGNLVVTTSVEGGVVFNESSADVDFRVESNGQTHKLFVNGGEDVVCFGFETPETIGGIESGVQIEGTDYAGGSLSIWRNANDDAGGYLNLGKSRGTAVNSDTIVQDDDDVGIINFIGADGGDRAHPVASIRGAVDGTPGSNDMPGRLEFMTTADGGTTLTERMVITNGGGVGVNLQAAGDIDNLACIGASNAQGVVVRGSNGGVLQIAGSSNDNAGFLGHIGFVNLANADVDASDADGQTKAFIRGLAVTSDSNAGDDSGTSLQFAAAKEAESLVEVCRMHGGASVGESAVFATNNYALIGTDHVSTSDTVGVALCANSVFSANAIAIKAQRVGNNSNGDVIQIMRGTGSVQGTISVSGSTVSYNAFTGSHWSRLTDNSKPTILQGTVMETLDEMCDWYRAKWSVKYTEDDVTDDVYKESDIIPSGKELGDRKGTFKKDDIKSSHVEYISLPDGKKDGDTFTHNSERYGTVTATIEKEEDFKHVKCKVSDTAESKNVYGVFQSWDEDDDCVNDMYVNALGSAEVRVHKDQTISRGDLLTSNGDGTAKNIIRTKTIGKVLTNIKQNTYEDGSYTVPCSLYCG